MRVKTVILAGAGAANTTLVAAAQASTAGTPWTLAGGAAVLSPPKEVTFTGVGDISTVILRLVGLDRSGNLITEDIQGPGAAATVTTKKIYSSVTSITPQQSSANTASAGVPQRVCSGWYMGNTTGVHSGHAKAQVQAHKLVGVTFAAGIIEKTNEPFMQISGEGADPQTVTSALAAVGDNVLIEGFTAIRIVNTQAAGTLKATISQGSF